MSSNRLRRIAKEIEETTKDKEARVILQPAGGQSDLTHLEGRFTGPPDTPYEGGQFSIDIKIPNDYPFRPPIMKFATKIWHPNVSSQTVSCSESGRLEPETDVDYRELYVWTLSPPAGRQFSLSKLHYNLYKDSSNHPNPKTLKTLK